MRQARTLLLPDLLRLTQPFFQNLDTVYQPRVLFDRHAMDVIGENLIPPGFLEPSEEYLQPGRVGCKSYPYQNPKFAYLLRSF
jgi:hypothetical protein